MSHPLERPKIQPWYGRYHFRFQKARADGSRTPRTTSIAALSEPEALERLNELLGGRPYCIDFLGFEEIPVASWDPAYRLACGLDLKGNPRPTSAAALSSTAPAAPKSRPARAA